MTMVIGRSFLIKASVIAHRRRNRKAAIVAEVFWQKLTWGGFLYMHPHIGNCNSPWGRETSQNDSIDFIFAVGVGCFMLLFNRRGGPAISSPILCWRVGEQGQQERADFTETDQQS